MHIKNSAIRIILLQNQTNQQMRIQNSNHTSNKKPRSVRVKEMRASSRSLGTEARLRKAESNLDFANCADADFHCAMI